MEGKRLESDSKAPRDSAAPASDRPKTLGKIAPRERDYEEEAYAAELERLSRVTGWRVS